ncbi:MAG: lipid-A-disaccharide synthase [Desulfovibrionaceae bacterium]|nr:lipid-A-disaccharide synthase [Desulfovibrionaceae bacterium]
MGARTFWINTGELSGDMQGALLLNALKKQVPHAHFVGMGGVHLAEAGLETLFRIEDLSVMGITEVIGHLPKIFRMLADIKAAMTRIRPEAVIVIDAPDFHFRVIKAARELEIPVYYYISPKVWAWREGRAVFIREHVRRLISILPFEADFYRRFGMNVDYVGNPLIDSVNYPALKNIRHDPDLVGFLPGSRKKEISALLPAFGGAARILRQRLPHVSFACVRAPGIDESLLRAYWPEDVPVDFVSPDNRFAFMRRCKMLIAASGTVTLESAIAGTPAIVVYKVSPLSFAVGKLLVKVPFISLPNLILGREVFPELLQKQCDAVPLADAALRWLLPPPGNDPLDNVREDMREIRRLLGEPGAADRAATVILKDLQSL